MNASIGGKKPNITNRKANMKTITEKVKKKKKKQYHPPSRPLTLAQVDLEVVDQMDLVMAMTPRNLRLIVVGQKEATLQDRLPMRQQMKA